MTTEQGMLSVELSHNSDLGLVKLELSFASAVTTTFVLPVDEAARFGAQISAYVAKVAGDIAQAPEGDPSWEELL